MFLQQDMSGHLILVAVATELGTTAFMQGADELDEPTQRTLTSAIARVGTTDWSMTTSAINIQASLLRRVFISRVILPR